MLALLIISIVVVANDDEDCYNMMNWFGWGGWGMIIFPLLWILIIGGIVVFFVKEFLGKNSQSPHEKLESALEILKERYAKGEITKKQFKEMKNDIEE